MTIPAALLTRSAQIAAKIETTEGTAENLTAAEAALTVFDPKFVKNVTRHKRKPARKYMSQIPALVGIRLGRITFKMELTGSGAVATAPSFDSLLRACGFQKNVVKSIAIGAITGGPFVPGEAITASGGKSGRVAGQVSTGDAVLPYVLVDSDFANLDAITGGTSGATATASGSPTAAQGFEYTPLTTAPPSVTIAMYTSGVRQRLVGARGSVKFTAKVGEPMMLEFEFLGVYDATTDVALLSPTYSTVVPATFLSAALQIHGYEDVVFTKFDVDMNCSLQPRRNANAAAGAHSVFIGDREPSASLDPEFTLVATHDWHGKVISGATGRLATKIGSAAGNLFWIGLPLVQYAKADDDDEGGVARVGLDLDLLSANVNTGDDEIQIVML